MTEPIRVLILDDHEVVRRGVRDLLELEDDMKVVSEAATAAEALARVPPTRPDVAVLDVRLPDGSGVDVCREIRSRHPEVQCLMLTSYSDDEALLEAALAGAAGYVLKQIRANDLVEAVRRVAAGESLIPATLRTEVLTRAMADRTRQCDPAGHLSPQEQRILDLLGEGLSNRQIAARMFLAEKTVKNYVSHVLTKLGMERRTEAAVFACRRRSSAQHTPG